MPARKSQFSNLRDQLLVLPVSGSTADHTQVQKITRPLIFALAAWLLLTQLKCVPYYFVDWDWGPAWTLTNLDNGGVAPVQAASDEAPRAAYGIRLANEVVYPPQEEEAKDAYVEISSISSRVLQKISVLAYSSFDSLPAGSDLSGFFRARFEPGALPITGSVTAPPMTRYVPLDEAVSTLNLPNFFLLNNYHTDLLLLNAPPPGEYQFAVRLEFETRTDTALIVFDTLLITNPIRLK